MPRIAIIGLGLIGGSLGLALKSAIKDHGEIVGYDRDSQSSLVAQASGAVDDTAPDPAKAVANADFVIVAPPIQAVESVFQQIAPHLKPGAIVTDTASTKADVLASAEQVLPANVAFVGGHPMAGKETPGIAAADGLLFQGRVYCIVPAGNTTPRATAVLSALAQAIGATPHTLDAQAHDCYVAGVSHLPALLSTALVATVSSAPSWENMSRLAATGFRDVSRLASGDVIMHRDMCVTNDKAIAKWIDRLIEELDTLRNCLRSQDASEEILQFFESARKARDAWLERFQQQSPGDDSAAAAAQLLELLGKQEEQA